ncbi:hypothetical protein CRE_05870 [Caenorhabditis remanei]|uniref:SCP domain-containing protein n=1 Tax=Caenorhabditis remanei TaxID=31234 RepID=E3MNI1_CAERE|nr:hypothetical protein CRE_05870 [Caenorhabditis remanei]
MKTSLLFGFILLYVLSLTVEAVKGNFSKEEQKKLLDALNQDRKEVFKTFNVSSSDLIYGTGLEKEASELECDSGAVWLQYNSVAHDFWNEVYGVKGGMAPRVRFFDLRAFEIGCSKESKCSKTIEKEYMGRIIPEKFVGKEMVMLGGCIIALKEGNDHSRPVNEIFESPAIPNASKYGDLLGLKLSSVVKNTDAIEGVTSGSGNLFNFIVFIGFSLFCI